MTSGLVATLLATNTLTEWISTRHDVKALRLTCHLAKQQLDVIFWRTLAVDTRNILCEDGFEVDEGTAKLVRHFKFKMAAPTQPNVDAISDSLCLFLYRAVNLWTLRLIDVDVFHLLAASSKIGQAFELPILKSLYVTLKDELSDEELAAIPLVETVHINSECLQVNLKLADALLALLDRLRPTIKAVYLEGTLLKHVRVTDENHEPYQNVRTLRIPGNREHPDTLERSAELDSCLKLFPNLDTLTYGLFPLSAATADIIRSRLPQLKSLEVLRFSSVKLTQGILGLKCLTVNSKGPIGKWPGMPKEWAKSIETIKTRELTKCMKYPPRWETINNDELIDKWTLQLVGHENVKRIHIYDEKTGVISVIHMETYEKEYVKHYLNARRHFSDKLNWSPEWHWLPNHR